VIDVGGGIVGRVSGLGGLKINGDCSIFVHKSIVFVHKYFD
jgi:hypothetical protein